MLLPCILLCQDIIENNVTRYNHCVPYWVKYELFEKDSHSLIKQSSIPYVPYMAKHSMWKTFCGWNRK